MTDSRLHSIYIQAGRLFNTKGYANTRVSEIAAATGIATGTMYNLFESKKAILTFVILTSFEKEHLNDEIEIPIKEIDMNIVMNLSMQLYDRVINHIMQITDSSGNINRGFVDMISDIFDMLADILLATSIIERNADILPQLANAFFAVKDAYMKKMEENLELYMKADEVRQLEYVKIHVQSITDIITWWAANAYISLPDIVMPRETARKIAIDILERAYLTKCE